MLSGPLSQTSRVVILQNNRKQNDKSPDYFLFLAEQEREERQAKDSETEDVPF